MLRLAHAWHARVLADGEVSHAFAHGYHPEHTERLAAYWGEALGGPAAYTRDYGDESAVVRLHSGNGRHDEMNRRAVACFDQALADAGLAGDERLRRVLHDYFAWPRSPRCTATTSPRATSRTGWRSRAGPGTAAGPGDAGRGQPGLTRPRRPGPRGPAAVIGMHRTGPREPGRCRCYASRQYPSADRCLALQFAAAFAMQAGIERIG